MAGIACLALTACDNDDDDAVNSVAPTASRMELITSTNWTLVSSDEIAFNDLPDALKTSPFSRDDIFRFKANGEAVRDEGPTKEEGKPQIVEVARWSFLNQERNLDAGFKSLPLNDEIVELTKRRMVLRRLVGNTEKLTVFEAQF
ncbi:hypothetical protein [Adhaeribacter terreus]|uniref:META domain-containing protein n=1 Tax=Adhaeribacter terreus TaxID=529703 RepID=A0ABW0EDT5_9BACT